MMKVIAAIVALFVMFTLSGCADNTPAIDSQVTVSSGNEEELEVEAKMADPADELEGTQLDGYILAKEYIEVYNLTFSRKSLIGQLVFEDIPEEDAIVAVDILNPDYQDMANRKAESYMEGQEWTHNLMVKQLVEAEGYSEEQAKNAADYVGL